MPEMVGTEKDNKTLDEINEFDENISWLSDHLEELRREYPDKYIAVKDKQVVDSDDDLKSLLEKLKDSGIDPGKIPVEFISSTPKRYILWLT